MKWKEKSCKCCGAKSVLIAEAFGVCLACIRSRQSEAQAFTKRAHELSRAPFGLPTCPPQAPDGVECKICINSCRISNGKVGYCGVRMNKDGTLIGGTPQGAAVSWYYDPLPTNCVASWVCAACSESYHTSQSHKRRTGYGYRNLAVFYEACSFDCLFCQNWHFRQRSLGGVAVSAEELADQVDDNTACICYFGGDPTPQIAHSITASRRAIERRQGEQLHICWETNGSMESRLLSQMMEISMESDGCIKFDLKAWSEELHIALCGLTNRRTLENFRMLAEKAKERPEPPLAIASTLLVPGYIDEYEVSAIARFIASLNCQTPYSLLAFSPQYRMNDLPTTSRSQAEACHRAAKEAGLENVKIGNVFLLDALI